MATKYILTGIPYTLEDVKLGSLIPAPKSPSQDTFDPLTILVANKDFRSRPEENVDFDFEGEGKSSFDAGITKFLRMFGLKAKTQSVKLESRQARIHELVKPRSIFTTLIANEDCKKWLENARENGEKPHLVVGYKTYLDASKKTEFIHDTTAEVAATIPAGAIAQDPNAALPGGSVLDSGAKANISNQARTTNSSELKGERIFAISLRKVIFRFFSSKVDGARLENKNCWIIPGFRGSDDDDAVEVDLDDSFGDGLKIVAVQETESGKDEFVIDANDSDDD